MIFKSHCYYIIKNLILLPSTVHFRCFYSGSSLGWFASKQKLGDPGPFRLVAPSYCGGGLVYPAFKVTLAPSSQQTAREVGFHEEIHKYLRPASMYTTSLLIRLVRTSHVTPSSMQWALGTLYFCALGGNEVPA